MLKAVQLGKNAALNVSQLCLGTMNFGEPGRGHQGDWTLGLDDARPLFKAAIDRGLFYFDCADIYGIGASERVVGQLLRELLPRDEYVLATKIAMPMGRGRESRRPVTQTCLRRGERMPDAAWPRLHRPPRHSPTSARCAGPRTGADRRIARGTARRRQGGQSALSRRVVDVRLAVRRAAADGADAWLDAVRLDAEPLQPRLSRGRTRDESVLRQDRVSR